MLSAIRRRMTWANVAMTLALVFAMSGGAFAAKKYLITNTKQISPKVLAQLKGAKGPAGPQGPQGPAGANGKDGAPGLQGEKGAQGLQGEKGAQGIEGKEGKQGLEGKAGKDGTNGVNGKSVTVSGTATGCAAGGSTVEVEGSGVKHEVCNGVNGQTGFTETLPPGKTEKGTWVMTIAPEEELALASISFSIPLAAPLDEAHSIIVPAGDKTTAHCSAPAPNGPGGTVGEPKADSGYLCVYITELHNVYTPFTTILPDFSNSGAAPAGALLHVFTEEGKKPGAAYGMGTWAVTG